MFLCFLHCQVGGYEVIKDKFPKAFPQTMLDNMNNSNYSYKDCGVPPDNFFHLMHDPSEDDLPWTGVVFGLTVSGMWYWCSDQVIVQRALAAKVYRSLLDIIYHIVYVNFFFSLSLVTEPFMHPHAQYILTHIQTYDSQAQALTQPLHEDRHIDI